MPAVALRIPLQPGETWHSYLTRSAQAHQCTLSSLARHVGLLDQGQWPAYHGLILDPERSVLVAANLGLAATDVDAMHLAVYDQRAFDLTGLTDITGRRRLDSTRRVTHQGWVFLAGTRYCCACLAEDGIWRLSWRLPWTTTCPHHRLWLHHTCQTCAGTPGLYTALHASAPSRNADRPDNRTCDLPAPPPVTGVCGAHLATQRRLPAPDSAIRATTAFGQTVAQGHGVVIGAPHTSLETLRAWQSAIGLAVALGRTSSIPWGRNHRWASPPRDPRVMHDLVLAGSPLVTACSPELAADVLARWCLDAGIRSPHRDTFARVTRPSAALTPAITTLLRRAGRTHILLARERFEDQHHLPVVAWGIDDIPQLVWPCALPPHRWASHRPDILILRVVTSLILVRIHDGHPWAEAGARIGVPPAKAQQWTRYCFSSTFSDLRTDLLTAARTLSTQLQLQPARATWAGHPLLPQAHGVHALQIAQNARCRRVDPDSSWCPCSVPARPS